LARETEVYEEMNIKIDLREIEWDGMDWIDLAQKIGTSGRLL
jgi:hypothetical protein